MTHARLSITLPERTWIGTVSRRYPDVDVTVLAAIPDEQSGFALARIEGDRLEDFIADMRRQDGITEAAVIRRGDREFVVHFETNAPLLLFASRESGMPIRLPVHIRNGRARAEFTGGEGRLTELGEKLDEMGVAYDLEYVQRDPDLTELLTDRQLELLRAAVEAGYYDHPRRCSMTELADSVGIAKSTCCEILQRVESRLIGHYLNRVNADATATDPAAPGGRSGGAG